MTKLNSYINKYKIILNTEQNTTYQHVKFF